MRGSENMGEIKLKLCPKCGGKIKLYSNINPNDNFFAFARCTACKEEYPLPTVKLRTWKSNPIRISKKMMCDAEKAWNKRVGEVGKENGCDRNKTI